MEMHKLEMRKWWKNIIKYFIIIQMNCNLLFPFFPLFVYSTTFQFSIIFFFCFQSFLWMCFVFWWSILPDKLSSLCVSTEQLKLLAEGSGSGGPGLVVCDRPKSV